MRARPEDDDLLSPRNGAVDPVAIRRLNPLEQCARTRDLEPVRTRPHRARDDDEEDEHGEWHCDRRSSGNEQKEGHESDPDDSDCYPVAIENEVLVDRPQLQQPERVRPRGLTDELGEREEKRECESRAGRDGRCEPRPRSANLDPGEQRDDEERDEEEQVAILNPFRGKPRGERRYRERAPDDEGERHREVLSHPGRHSGGEREEKEQRSGGQDPRVEDELLQVPQPHPRDPLDVVAALPDDAVGAEEI